LSLALLAAELMKNGPASAGDGDGLSGGLADLGEGALGIMVEGAKNRLSSLLGNADAILRNPAFLRADFPDEAFQASLRDLRSALRRRENEGATGGAKALGSEEGLRGLDLDAARGYWKAHYKPEEMRFVAVGDFEDELALSEATATLAAIPAPEASPVRQTREAGASPTSATRKISLGPADFLVAPRGAYALLAELLAMKRSGEGSGGPWTLDGAGLGISLPASDAGALDLGSSTAVELARSRALSRIFDDSGRALALAMARAVAAGGSGREPFVFASEIERASVEELRKAADRLFAGS
jgi:predicted Zn-dependent peptidase